LQKGADVNAQNKTGATPLYKLATSELTANLEHDSVDFILDFIHALLKAGLLFQLIILFVFNTLFFRC
jgi:hypothetical protein